MDYNYTINKIKLNGEKKEKNNKSKNVNNIFIKKLIKKNYHHRNKR